MLHPAQRLLDVLAANTLNRLGRRFRLFELKRHGKGDCNLIRDLFTNSNQPTSLLSN
jgi:hypothetical protein